MIARWSSWPRRSPWGGGSCTFPSPGCCMSWRCLGISPHSGAIGTGALSSEVYTGGGNKSSGELNLECLYGVGTCYMSPPYYLVVLDHRLFRIPQPWGASPWPQWTWSTAPARARGRYSAIRPHAPWLPILALKHSSCESVDISVSSKPMWNNVKSVPNVAKMKLQVVTFSSFLVSVYPVQRKGLTLEPG